MSGNIRFEDWEKEQMQDPAFRAALERLEPAYQVARLRVLRGWTQKELARRAGTRQPSIARLESGEREPSLSFLRRVVQALGGRVEVRIVPEEVAEGVHEQGWARAVEKGGQAQAQDTIQPKSSEIEPAGGSIYVLRWASLSSHANTPEAGSVSP
jgi:transcriptional regulator with XRE-family HTH domain